jgi:hypothetical protein
VEGLTVAERQIGDLLDSLGVTADIDDGDMVPSALVLLKAVGEDGTVGLTLAPSEGLSWLDQLGMLAAAQSIVDQAGFESRSDD